MGAVLDDIYQGTPTMDFYGDRTGSATVGIESFRQKTADVKNSFQLLKGHFTYNFDPELLDYKYITLLRNPLLRLISYYFYAASDSRNYLSQLIHKRRIHLVDFLVSDLSIETDNYQVRAISGFPFETFRERVTQEHCDLAKEALATGFAAFGLVERMDDALADFAATLGWNTNAIDQANVGEYPRELDLPSNVVDYCRSQNRFDFELYEYASELISNRSPTPPSDQRASLKEG